MTAVLSVSPDSAYTAQELVASVASPPGRIGKLNASVKKILDRYGSIVAQAKRLERRIGSAAVRRRIAKLLIGAKRREGEAKSLQGAAVVDALAKLNGASALREIKTARVRAADARTIAASARDLAARVASPPG